MSRETPQPALPSKTPLAHRKGLYLSVLFTLSVGMFAGTSGAYAEPGAEVPDELPPKTLEVTEQSEPIEQAQEQIQDIADKTEPTEQVTEAAPKDDIKDEGGGLPVEEDNTEVGSKLPTADELLSGATVEEPDEPTVEEVESDLKRQEGEQEESRGAWTILEDLQKIQAMLDANKRLEELQARGDYQEGYDLTPYIDEAAWYQALALKREGECTEALKVAKPYVDAFDEQPGGIQYAIAKINKCAGNTATYKKQIKQIATRTDISAELAKLELGLPVKPRTSGSEEDIETVTLMVKARSAAKLTRHARTRDEGLEKLADLRGEAKSSWSWYKIRLMEAEALERADRIEDASQVWLSIYLRTRDWRSGAQIEDMVEKFERRHKVEVLGLGERADRVRELVARGRYKDARKANTELVKWAKMSSKQVRAWSNYRKALEAERKKDRERAVALFEKAEKDMERDDGRIRLYFGWARALRRLDRDNEAITLYDRMCEEYPADELCADAMYEAGRLLQYQNKHDLASAHFERLVGLFPDHRDVPDALWRAAFSLYLKGDYEGVDPVLRHLRDFYGDEHDESELSLGLKAQYWLGVAALKRGDRITALTELQKTIDRDPLTWYGKLAMERLEEIGVKPLMIKPSRQLGVDDQRHLGGVYLPRDERMERAAELIKAGLYEEAIRDVSAKLRLHPAPEGADRVLASLNLAVGRPDLGHWNMKKHLRGNWPDVYTLRDWGTAFPLNYMEYAHEWGTKYNVDPFLVQAIIRQESGFRESVKSYAGAVGLMQLMPGTARYTAKVFLEPEQGQKYRRRDLIKPEKNIQLGSMYIRVHTAHASDTVALALAGYNAGGKPLKRWVRQYGDREMDAWVESITYKEARGYVRKVMTSYLRYSWLYGEQMPIIGLKVPTTLRSWGEIPEVDALKASGPISLLDIEQ